jgi:hypothetical protein
MKEIPMTKIVNLRPRCTYPGCNIVLALNQDPTYPSLKDLGERLGRRVTEADIANYPEHPGHGGTSFEATMLFFRTLYQGKPLVLKNTATPTTASPTKPSLRSLKDRALQIRFHYSTLGTGRLSFDGSQKAAVQSFNNGTTLERELQREANTERLILINKSRRTTTRQEATL